MSIGFCGKILKIFEVMRPGRRLYHGKVVKSTQRKKKERKENREVSEKEGGCRGFEPRIPFGGCAACHPM